MSRFCLIILSHYYLLAVYVYVKMVEKLNQRNFRNDIFVLHNYPLIFNIHSSLMFCGVFFSITVIFLYYMNEEKAI